MNSVLLEIKEYFKKNLCYNLKTQEGYKTNKDYIVEDIKSYYDLEGALRLAIKVYITEEKRTEVVIIGADLLEDLTNENQEKWFDEINK